MKMLKKGEKVRGEGGGGCVQRMEVIVSEKEKKVSGGGGVRVYVNGEVKLL